MYNYDFMTPLIIWALIGMTFGSWKIIELIIDAILWACQHISIAIH